MTELPGQRPPRLSAAYFDQWYADLSRTPSVDEIKHRHLRLPEGMLSTSLLGGPGIAEVMDALHLRPGGTVLDLACGRGGYGLEVARATGARLIGVDFSAEAVRQATEYAARLGRAAEFRVGDLISTGLPTACASAAFVVDAMQFAEPAADAYRELRRVLVPGGRVAVGLAGCGAVVPRRGRAGAGHVRPGAAGTGNGDRTLLTGPAPTGTPPVPHRHPADPRPADRRQG